MSDHVLSSIQLAILMIALLVFTTIGWLNAFGIIDRWLGRQP